MTSVRLWWRATQIRMKNTRPFLFAVLMLACHADAAIPEQLAGSWYGTISNGKATVHWTTSRGKDGRFQTEFLNCTEGKHPRKWIDIGKWSIEGNQFIVTTVGVFEDGKFTGPAGAELKSQIDKYTAIEIAQDLFRYEDAAKTALSERRVAKKEELACK